MAEFIVIGALYKFSVFIFEGKWEITRNHFAGKAAYNPGLLMRPEKDEGQGRGQQFYVRPRPKHMTPSPRPQCVMNHAT